MKRTLRISLFLVITCLVPLVSAMAQTTVTISNPPTGAATGGTISVTETVWNGGVNSTGGGIQTLSLVPNGAGSVITLGTRSIPGLQGGALSTVTTTVPVPPNTPAGTYRLGAGNAGCTGNCLKSAGTINITSTNSGNGNGNGGTGNGGGNAAPVVVTVNVIGPGTVSGGREAGYFQGPYFTNCSPSGGITCTTSGPAGTAFVLSVTPGTIPASGPFGQSHQASFAGWSGCNGMPQGNGLRVVATNSVTCTAKFQ